MDLNNKNARSRKSNEAAFYSVEGERGSHVVIATVKGESVGDEPRIYAGFDSRLEEAVFAQVTVFDGVGKLVICEKLAGIVSAITEYVAVPGLSPGKWFELVLCCEAGSIAAMAITSDGVPVRCRAKSHAANGSQCGIGSGTVKNEVRFDDFTIKRHFPASCLQHPIARQDGCPHCGETCPCCQVDQQLN